MEDALAHQFNAKYARLGLTCSVMGNGHLVVKMGHTIQSIDVVIAYLMENGAYCVDREGDDLTVWIGVDRGRHTDSLHNTRVINPYTVATGLIIATIITAFWTQIYNTLEMYWS